MRQRRESPESIARARRNFVWTFAVLSLVWVALMAGTSDHKDVQLYDAQYCEMVELHISSRGEYGWPDYRGNYEQECPPIPMGDET